MTSLQASSDTAFPVPADAERAALRLSAALEAVGFVVERDMAFCRANVTTTGLPFVEIGPLPPSAAHRLAVLFEQFGPLLDDEPRDLGEHALPAERAALDAHASSEEH